MWVVKLGGSLDTGGTMAAWAGRLAGCGVPLIICPGGGPFADQVRDAQRRWPISDATAHKLAILAMEQTAYLLHGLCPDLIPVTDSGSIPEPDSRRRARLWFPAAELIGDPGIPGSWDITSDSLAAILARRVGADGLVLIKSAPLWPGRAPAVSLQKRGLLDAGFQRYGAGCGCGVWLLSSADGASMVPLLTGRSGGLRIEFE